MGWFRIDNGVLEMVRRGELGRLDLVVYAVLARHADADAMAYPSQKTIATYCRADAKNVRASIKNLETSGVITVTRSKTKGGKPNQNEYTLIPLETEASDTPNHHLKEGVAPKGQGRHNPKNKTKLTRRGARSGGNYGKRKKNRPSSRY